MEWSVLFFINSIFLGIGLAMDAFSVSLVNGLNDTGMRKRKMCSIAGVFAFFQAMMPMLGWMLVHTLLQHFQAFRKLTPWAAAIILLSIGGKMLTDGIRGKENNLDPEKVGTAAILLQGTATSIDALSVGVTIGEYGLMMAAVCSLIIAVVTFFVCFAGIDIGKKVGARISGKATILGSIILILIGLEIFITGVC